MGVAPLPFFHIPGRPATFSTYWARYTSRFDALWYGDRGAVDRRNPLSHGMQFVRSAACCALPKFVPRPQALSLKQKSTSTQGWEPRMLLHSPICLLEAWCASTSGSPIVFCHFETASQAASSSWLNTPTEWSAVGFAARTRGESHFIRRNCRTPKSATWRTDFARRSSRRTSLSLRNQYRTD